MGWYINECVNTVEISEECAKDIHRTDPYRWDSVNDVFWTNRDGCNVLNFVSDDMEHMDFVSDPSVQQILKKHKVKGDICFASEDGDNAGDAWGYRFDGMGGMKLLVAERVWTEVEPPKPKKKTTKKVSSKKKKAKKK